MPDTKKNALAELANELNYIKNILSLERFYNCSEEVDKAQRIIAELARVKVEAIKENPNMVGGAFINLMAECRAVAEEGEVKR